MRRKKRGGEGGKGREGGKKREGKGMEEERREGEREEREEEEGGREGGKGGGGGRKRGVGSNFENSVVTRHTHLRCHPPVRCMSSLQHPAGLRETKKWDNRHHVHCQCKLV